MHKIVKREAIVSVRPPDLALSRRATHICLFTAEWTFAAGVVNTHFSKVTSSKLELLNEVQLLHLDQGPR